MEKEREEKYEMQRQKILESGSSKLISKLDSTVIEEDAGFKNFLRFKRIRGD